MSDQRPRDRAATPEPEAVPAIRRRLFAAAVAISAGITALIVAILLVRSVLA